MSKTASRALLLIFLGSAAAAGADSPASPYAGLEKREIKALSADEIAAYLEGKGMGLARAAELNHYPGPVHVLELSTELGLTADQRARTEALFRAMESEAISLGKQLIEREWQLDDMFVSKTITREKLRRSLEAIGLLQGRVRQVHLGASEDSGSRADPQIRPPARLRRCCELHAAHASAAPLSRQLISEPFTRMRIGKGSLVR